jgi:RimJ/RimL family protein N-acetyltransferase
MKSGHSGFGHIGVRLRRVEPRDLGILYEIQAQPEGNEMAGTKPRTREAFFAVWDKHFADPGVSGWVIELESSGVPEIVGSVASFVAEGRHCVGYWLAQAHWGKGIASQALTLFLALEVQRPLHATAAESNVASRKILEHCGFECVGSRFGEETERYLARKIVDFVLR